jgi:hypothetical protein
MLGFLTSVDHVMTYGQYEQYQQQEHLANQEQMTADSYSDASWNWDAWGPWAPGYGFGYGGRYGW